VAFRLRVVAVFVVALAAVFVVPAERAGALAQSGAVITGSVVDRALTPLPGVVVSLERETRQVAGTTTGADGRFRFTGIAAGAYVVRAQLAGFTTFSKELRVAASATTVPMPIVMLRPGEKDERQEAKLAEPAARSGVGQPVAPPPPTRPVEAPPVAAGAAPPAGSTATTSSTVSTDRISGLGAGGGGGRGGRIDSNYVPRDRAYPPSWRETGETYAHIEPNRFKSTAEHPLSTFGADVDTASYTNVRRFLTSGQLPPRDAVRVEELVNYFRFPYAAPRDGRPMAITTEIGPAPWAPSHRLVLIGARAVQPESREIVARNLVLLIDVSGSMAPPERLPLIKTALGMFVDTLRADDTLSIVTYAGTSGVALHPTPARHRDVIQRAIANLRAAGSTNGGDGLVTAYRMARHGFVPGGINRVILATDGDFNVGIVSQAELERLITRERDSGVFLSVLGVGSGNLKDRTMEMLADKGNGNYAYLDSLQEARRVLIREGEATINAVAKDVKFQVEFNPAAVSAWKLIGYENRLLRAQDFNNDRKDAGEMGAGHTVTALYEVVPIGVNYSNDDGTFGRPAVDPLRYQPNEVGADIIRPDPPVARSRSYNGEWLTVKARYKLPDDETSQLITHHVRADGRSVHLPLAAAVAEFGLLLRDQPHNVARWNALVRRVAALDGPGALSRERADLRELVELARGLVR
jgi:Ca-activated chloride channel family protein